MGFELNQASALRLLVAEDSEDDFEILLRELRRGGYDLTALRVATLGHLQGALQHPWDLVISDWSMPGFGGRIVLDTLAACRLNVPCIVISGTIGEEPAVEALRAGALDFLSKDRPTRFVPAIQRALREANDRRQTLEIRRRGDELELQNRRIQEASRLKSEFLANMSHELRTPLNAIIGFAELLHDGQVDPASPQHQEFLGDILSSGRHLLQLINDVLDLAKVEAGKLDFRPESMQIAKVVGEVSAILRTTVSAKRIKLETVIDPAVTDLFLDPGRFKQVAYNFLSNALKFSAAGGRVTVRVVPEGGEHFRFEVEDSGIGIAPADLGRLFVEFQQLESGTSKRHQGTGLGLALTKRLVEAQGGSVGVTSEVGIGSTFFAVLPRRVVATIEPSPPPVVRIAREGARTVLVVEDDIADQAQLVAALASAGYAVELAGTGAEALMRWRARDFDAITIDLLLPDMSGLDLLAALHGERRNAAVPVIVITVVPDAKVVAGFAVHDVIHKPLDRDTLVASLVRAGVENLPPSPIGEA
jgi:signal transduction histidine kinase